MHWKPSASHQTILERAKINRIIRDFFAQRHVVEVETPILGKAGVTDPYIESLTSEQLYLQTSPEYFMKRLLASGSGDIYQLGKVFRKEEVGRLHHSEFTLLEWYRLGFNQWDLMAEVADLITLILGPQNFTHLSYRQAFIDHLAIDPFIASMDELQALALQHIDIVMPDASKDDWLNLLLSHLIEPEFKQRGAVFLHSYPPSQAVLAKTQPDEHGQLVAQRFELYIQGIELCNGFHELTDAEQQLQRFQKDNVIRQAMGLKTIDIDHNLIAALSAGMPECSGVAIGVDRVLMLRLGVNTIDEVLSFRW